MTNKDWTDLWIFVTVMLVITVFFGIAAWLIKLPGWVWVAAVDIVLAATVTFMVVLLVRRSRSRRGPEQ
jgi:membrane protein YdbS with pleckstrin-like domain